MHDHIPLSFPFKFLDRHPKSHIPLAFVRPTQARQVFLVQGLVAQGFNENVVLVWRFRKTIM